MLKLDDGSLNYERSQIIQGIESEIQSGYINKHNKYLEIDMWRMKDLSGKLKSFGHVAARYLEDEPL